MKRRVVRVSVNVYSESNFTVKGHGVHSVYSDSVQALRERQDIDVLSNSIRRASVVHLHTVGPVSALLLGLSKRSVVTAHITPESLPGSVVGGLLLGRLWREYLSWFYNCADVVLSLHNVQEGELRRGGVRSRIVTVAPGILRRKLPSRGQARSLLGISSDEQVVLSVGQVQPRKAVRAFHRTAAALPNVRFIWVGGFPFGPLTANYREMRTLIRQSPHNVIHAGQMSRDNVGLYYAAADVYFHPSHQEHAPIAVLEAAAAGLPLILRDLECYRSLYPGRYLAATERSFTTQVKRLLADRRLCRLMAGHATALADLHSIGKSAAELANIYQELAGPQLAANRF
jgi:1,2-diacylglycerol-3-alpha-glucose alpha-1,2-galactosyltransferase